MSENLTIKELKDLLDKLPISVLHQKILVLTEDEECDIELTNALYIKQDEALLLIGRKAKWTRSVNPDRRSYEIITIKQRQYINL